uniref:Uncharacterized protein n=1 Tax=Opuntia streptacantha TaxID=393608 RepID=A0A7C8YLH2_OPUST
MDQQIERESLEKRPGILIIGSPDVGKRTLLARLLSVDIEDDSDSSCDVTVQGWTIDTKYYTADVAVWVANLHDGFSSNSLPNFNDFAALVMVFDMSELSTLAALKKWVSDTDIQKFDILLCIGNKVDLVPGHSAHDEYKRRLQKAQNSIANPDVDFSEYGISETEGSSLLRDDEPSCDIRRSCLDWCLEHNIEYVEACASNSDFDKCLSVGGDSQGVDRLFGALSAHMWPGMVLKSGNKVLAPSLPERQESSSEEESEYEGEYEVLSGGSADPWGDTEEDWVSARGPTEPVEPEAVPKRETEEASTSKASESGENTAREVVYESGEVYPDGDDDDTGKGEHLELEDLEQLMSEIANMRSNSRLMPDFQRREMAAKLAMRMAALFGDSCGDEGFE